MGKIIFVSDFDGTITLQDFYKLLMQQCIGQEAIDYYEKWKQTEKIGLVFLDKIFSWKQFTTSEIEGIIKQIPIDPYFRGFYEWVTGQMDFMIVSAGFDYYIHKVLKQEGYEAIPLITNPGSFVEGHLKIEGNPELYCYSEVYGINKAAVIRHLKQSYDTVIFAGDSEPDYLAALEADIVFAKADLIPMMEASSKPFYPITHFLEIHQHMVQLFPGPIHKRELL